MEHYSKLKPKYLASELYERVQNVSEYKAIMR